MASAQPKARASKNGSATNLCKRTFHQESSFLVPDWPAGLFSLNKQTFVEPLHVPQTIRGAENIEIMRTTSCPPGAHSLVEETDVYTECTQNVLQKAQICPNGNIWYLFPKQASQIELYVQITWEISMCRLLFCTSGGWDSTFLTHDHVNISC